MGWSARSLFSGSNPITVGILLYIAFFQMVIYRSRKNDASLLHARAATSIDHPEMVVTTTTTQQQKSGVGVWPRHPVVPPQNPVEWKPYGRYPMKVPYPVFVTSLPKSGTTSFWKYMQCGNQLAAHNWVTKKGAKRSSLLGVCIEKNIRDGRPPFEKCGENDVYTDTGYLNYDHDPGLQCFFPSSDGLEAIYASYPNATFMNVVRDSESWYTSLKNWSHSSLFVRFRLCNATGFPDGQSTAKDFMAFYEAHNEMIRQFVRDRPSITYIEVKLESSDTGRILEEKTGISERCWKKCKPEERHCEGDEKNKNAA